MNPNSRHSIDGPYEREDPIDELTRNVSTTCELGDELLEAVRTSCVSRRCESDFIRHFSSGLTELVALVGECNSALGSFDGDNLADDPLDPIGSVQLLIGDLNPLIDEARRLVDRVPSSDHCLARDLDEVVASLSGSIGLMTAIVNCYRST